MELTSIQAPAQGISQATVEQLSERLNEPEWLRERRLRSWETYERTPMPTTSDEEWRRTDLRGLKLDSFVVPAEPREQGQRLLIESDGPDDHRSGYAQVVDSYAVRLELNSAAQQQGVVFSTLSDAARNTPELIEPHLGALVPDDYGKFAALANALGTGMFLYVPTGVEVELPIQVSHTLTAAGGAVFPRTLVVAGRHSSVTLIDRYYSADSDTPSLSCGSVEVYTGEGARVRYANVQEWGRSVWHFMAQNHQIDRDGQDHSLNIALGGRMAKANVETRLAGPGAHAEMLGLYFSDGTQLFDHHTVQDHAAHHCTSDLLYKGVLRGSSRTVFSGLIRVRPGAQQTDAYQTNRNLLLSEHSRADSIPNLEIENNDVKCSHGASIGPIDQEQLFYLMSRGLSTRDAERMIVDGFFEPLINRIPLEGVRERLQRAIDEKMG